MPARLVELRSEVGERPPNDVQRSISRMTFIYHVGASAICPHGGQVTVVPGNPRVRVGGQPVATMGDQYLVAGCAFTVPGPKPQPCVKVQWMVPALRVRAGGQPVILQTSTGLCLSAEQIPQGPPTVVTTQPRVRGQ